jgi:hypothetical protein
MSGFGCFGFGSAQGRLSTSLGMTVIPAHHICQIESAINFDQQ